MQLGYKPPEEYVLSSNPLVDDDETESDEMWLIHCPISKFPEIFDKELTVKLDADGTLGGLEDSSGNDVHFVNFASQEVDATAIIPSQESVIAGKLFRRVSLVRFPEPKELLETTKARTQQKLVGAVTNSSGKYSNPTQSSRHKSRHSASTRSSRQKSVFSGFTETPKSSKRKHSESSAGKRGTSTSTVTGSAERSEKSKKKKKKMAE